MSIAYFCKIMLIMSGRDFYPRYETCKSVNTVYEKKFHITRLKHRVLKITLCFQFLRNDRTSQHLYGIDAS